ncbi:helix-turn-helix domain-containing protein [Bacteroidota bacterium]
MDLFNEEPKQFLVVSKETLKNFLLEFLEDSTKKEPKKTWVSTQEAMELLTIKSKSTLLDLRQNGEIEYSQPMKKIILYRYDSLLAYLEKHSRKTF